MPNDPFREFKQWYSEQYMFGKLMTQLFIVLMVTALVTWVVH